MVAIKKTCRHLAEIGESNPGYAVEVTNETRRVFLMANFRFERTTSGRRNKAVVLCDYAFGGEQHTGRFDPDDTFCIFD